MSESVCMRCGGDNPCWFAPNEVWNYVVAGPKAGGDPGGFLCPNCFILLAEAVGLFGIWELRPKRIAPPKQERNGCRKVILETLTASSPMTVRELRPLIEAELGPLHPKTPGIALQRLAKEGIVRSEGHKWFLAAPERPKTPGSQDR